LTFSAIGLLPDAWTPLLHACISLHIGQFERRRRHFVSAVAPMM
jgi:hypothetical protein